MFFGMLGATPGKLQGALPEVCGAGDGEGVEKMPEGCKDARGRKPCRMLVSSDVALLVPTDPFYFVS